MDTAEAAASKAEGNSFGLAPLSEMKRERQYQHVSFGQQAEVAKIKSSQTAVEDGYSNSAMFETAAMVSEIHGPELLTQGAID